MKEITCEEMKKWQKDSYLLIDVRDEGLRLYGMIPGALALDPEAGEVEKRKIAELPKEKKLVFYCEIGRRTRDFEEADFPEHPECFSLEGGYIGYVRSYTADEKDREDKQRIAEESIRKKFHKQLFSPFAKACKLYRLIEEGDHIAVCISGGKDSMLMAKLLVQSQILCDG